MRYNRKMDGFMEFTFLEFIKYDYLSILLVLGLIVLMLANRRNKMPAVFTLWIMTFIMVLSLFVEFVCKWSENDPSFADIRYWTTIIKYLISPTILMMQIMVLVKNKVLRGLLLIPNLISALAVTVGPYVTGLKVLSFSEEAILEAVDKDVREFVGDAEQFDDLTMMCVEYYGKPADKMRQDKS